MERYRDTLKGLLHPHGLLIAVLTVACAAGLLWVFGNGMETHPLAYVLYPVSAYTVVVLTIRVVYGILALRRRAYASPRLGLYLTRLEVKALVSVYVSFGVNLAYCVYKSVLAWYFRSAWFGTLAGYYAVISTVRFLLLRHVRSGEADLATAYRQYRFCGYLLLVLTIAVSTISVYVTLGGQRVTYPGYTIYLAALFTFYNFGMGIANLVRYRRLNNPVYSAGKVLTLATAFVSVLFLQTAMFASFGDGADWESLMNILTACAVQAVVSVMAVTMIAKANRELKGLHLPTRN